MGQFGMIAVRTSPKTKSHMHSAKENTRKYSIGEAAQMTALPKKTVRYYADIQLVAPIERSDAGYRLYTLTEVKKLVFVRKARAFGFSVDVCRELLSLYEDRERSSRDVKSIALARLQEIEQKMRELQTLHEELSHLAGNCHGDGRPDCPILESFANAEVGDSSPT